MEAVPRLPMVHFELKVSPEAPSFGPKLKQYIREFYHEDPESYGNEIRTLESLRASAVSSARNATLASCSALKRYYCQLHFLQSRFPMSKDGAAAVPFTWRDAYASMVCTLPDITFEMVCILYNIGAVHSYAGASESRDTADGMKLACTHFQCAAWAFQHLKDSYSQPSGVDLAPDIMQFMYQLMLAQAQECILEKSMMDNRKATIIAKVAVQVVDYYKLALNTLEQGGSEECSIAETVGSKLFKSWKRYVKFKLSYHSCVSLLYQGQQAEEQQKMGERVALYQASSEKLEEAIKLSKGMDNIEIINEALTFTMDVVEGKKKAAKNENEFIYHEEIPDRDSLPEVKGASLVKGIPFDVNDPEVSGPDIFGRLVPMKAHEASSLYSEEKAKLLRRVGAKIEEKDQELVTFMTSLQLEHLNLQPDMEHLPQELVDRCAALSAKPNAIQDLIDAMGKLADTYQDVESMLQEIRELLEQEEAREKEYQAIMGSRPPSIAATDLTREARKYEEAHAKASESNQTLHKAMTLNISNLRILALPLPELEKQIPSLRLLDVPVDDPVTQEMRRLVGKVEEMKNQRSSLASQLRDSICQDDITKQLVTRSSEPVENIFPRELEKHQQYVDLIDQNLSAQDNILKALTDVYAKYAGTRKATNEIIRKREATISGLISSYDAYEDLLAKSSKGVEFYRKLETNVSKLLQRVKGTCKVQDEEREHILAKNKKSLPSKKVPDETTYEPEPLPSKPGAPKLKDYLESMKRGGYTPGSGSYLNPAYSSQIPPSVSPQPVGSGSVESISSQQWVPSVRPAPVGSEGTGEQPPSLCSVMNTSLKSAGYTPEDKVPASAYMHSGSLQYSAFPVPHYPKQYASNLPDVPSSPDVDLAALKNMQNLLHQQPQQYSYDSSGQTYGYQFSNGTASYSSAPQVPSSYSQDVNSSSSTPYSNQSQAQNSTVATHYSNPSQMPPSYQLAASSDGVAPHLNPSRYSPAPQPLEQPVQPASPYSSQQSSGTTYAIRQADGAYYSFPAASSQAGTLYYPSQYAASYTSMQQAPVSYPCTPSQQPGAVYCMTGQMGNKYPTASTPSSVTEVRLPQENYHPAYSYDSSGYLPPTGVTDYQYMSSDPNISLYTSAGTYDTSQTSSSNKSVDGQTFAAQYGANVRQETPGQDQYYPSSYGGYQYGSTVELQATINHQQGVYGVQQGNYDQQQVTANQVVFGQQQGNYGQQQTTFDQQQANYGQLPAVVGQQQGMYSSQQPQMSDQQQTTGSQQQVSYDQQQATPSQLSSGTSNVDLLAGLDFTVNQAPLVPQQPAGEKTIVTASPSKQSTVSKPAQPPPPVVAPATNAASVEPKPRSLTPDVVPPVEEAKDKEGKATGKAAGKDPYSDPESLNQFVQEVEKYEKFVDGLTTKTLNGPTPLDMKWKELLELQEKDANKHSISVARCYPMKNRFPDILPYDDSRVELPSTKDDYINASYVKNVSALTPPYIVTQAPLPSTYSDFWAMVWEQQVEVVVCLLSNAELEEQVYWPTDKTQELIMGKMKLTLQSSNVRPHWTERILSLTVGETRASRIVVHLQFTAWPGSSFPPSPGPFLSFVCEALVFYQQQRVTNHPVVVHCLSGVGRTGLFVLITAAVCEVQAGRGLLDLVAMAAVMSSRRKNALRDREHLKFAYQALLYYAQDMLMKRAGNNSEEPERAQSSEVDPTRESRSDVEHLTDMTDPFFLRARQPEAKARRRFTRESFETRQKSIEAVAAAPGDPFSDIDPLWPLKRQ